MIVYYATFDSDGFPLGFWNSDIYPPAPIWSERPVDVGEDWTPEVLSTERHPAIPADATEITEAQWREFIENQGGRRWADGEVAPYEPPAPPPPLIALTADVLFFDRMTNGEYDALDASVRADETARVYRGWAAATSFTEGSDMWALLVKHLDLTVTATRRDELLARP